MNVLEYLEAIKKAMDLAQKAPDKFLPDVIKMLNHLGNLYLSEGRHVDAEGSYLTALKSYQMLCETTPMDGAIRAAMIQRELPDLALILNNLATVYMSTSRPDEAEATYDQSLSLRRTLAEAAPDQFLPDVAMTLHNLAILYSSTGRPERAETSYDEALKINRELARNTPKQFLPLVATTLYSIGHLYSKTGRPERAGTAFEEATEILWCLARRINPAFLQMLKEVVENLQELYVKERRLSVTESKTKVKAVLKKAESTCKELRL